MKYDPGQHHRRSIRLREYDYAQAGAYFITICTHDRECALGCVRDAEMHLSAIGQIVKSAWEELPSRFPTIDLDAFIIMPNHLHGIVILVGAQFIAPKPGSASTSMSAGEEGAINRAPTTRFVDVGVARAAPTLGEIVRAFKAVSTHRVRKEDLGDFAWQRNYYDHIIRNEQSLEEIRRYIESNPSAWDQDEENILRVSAVKGTLI